VGAPEELRGPPAGELPGGFRREDPTKVSYLRGPPGHYEGTVGVGKVLARQPYVLAIPIVVPRVYGFVPHPTGGKLLLHDSRVVSTALGAGALRASEGRPLAAVALDHYALWAPPVDRAELDFFNVVVSFGTLDYLHHLASFSPFPDPLQSGAVQLPAILLAEDVLAVN
jgi:hypothetical protein